MSSDQSGSIDSITVSDTDIIDLNSYASIPSYSLGSGVTTITLPSSSFTSSGTSASYTINSSGYTYNPSVNITSDGITMKEGSDIKVGGKSLTAAIEKIEERLGILHPNPELEEKWENLRGLRKAYMELEKEILEKEKMWKILKEK